MLTVTVTIQEVELFPKMKKRLRGHFDSNNEVIAAVHNFLDVQDTTAGLNVWMYKCARFSGADSFYLRTLAYQSSLILCVIEIYLMVDQMEVTNSI